MPKIKKCSVCGKEFLSKYGAEICSEECKQIRKKEQDRKGNLRRYSGESSVPFEKVCPECGKEFETLRNVYCSKECAGKARKRNVKEENVRYYKEHRDEIIRKAKKK